MKTSIKLWDEDERPREKLISKGCSSLSNAELLAIVLRSGTPEKTALDMAREVLKLSSGKLKRLSEFSVEQYKSISGIGDAKAVSLMAIFELTRRMNSETEDNQPIIRESSTVMQIMGPILQNLPHEECWAIYLNRGNRLLSKERISIGGVDHTSIDIRIIVKKAVEKLASSVILVHNHPSGNRFPGEADRNQTAALKNALNVFDIALLDHIIVAGNKYFSFSDENY
ncbi:MAG: DNA repair protein RadC [Bacteroidales bacterium]|nr:DNA repair protein RadC [Candidatus Cacconaster equi]